MLRHSKNKQYKLWNNYYFVLYFYQCSIQQSKLTTSYFKTRFQLLTLDNFEPGPAMDIRQKCMEAYNYFKQELLTAMIDHDPLAILESRIFQMYEEEMEAIWRPAEDQPSRRMETKINKYAIDGLCVDVVQRRSHSCDTKRERKEERVWRNRVRALEEQGKIDLMIWSNIMNNNLRPTVFEDQQNLNKRKENHFQKQNCMQSSNLDQMTSSALISSEASDLFSSITSKILKNPSKANIKLLLKQLFCFVQESNEKIISELNRLRKENDRLVKNAQENSMKELQNIVQIKHLQRRIQEKDEELKLSLNKIRQKEEIIRDRESQLNKIIRQKLREIQNLQEENIRKNYIEELKQKMAIDSIRRATLCSLSKERFEIELKKQELGLSITNVSQGSSSRSATTDSNYGSTDETRCDYQ